MSDVGAEAGVDGGYQMSNLDGGCRTRASDVGAGCGHNGVMLSADITPGLYRHYKGNLYEVIGAATHSETEEPLVVYRALYGVRGMWVRPFEMFVGEVEVDGKRMRRFAPVGEVAGHPGRDN